ncbi:helicase HerA domain-containing protein [Halosegnis sp.]|uniref:helicase HerA domain-containing protein n=1 Tax=Halosegnis sp. TaxID=2864959 RepID=UPI0035D3F6D2
MAEEHITVGEVSAGEAVGAPVELPIVDILTGRGFITGKSGSGKSNSASVVAEKLLDRGYSLLCVDIDGEYYGLKEEYEILHVGADDECDLQVSVEHAEKLASLALEQGVPIILDVSSFLDERDARELLTEVSKHLFAKEKKLKQPFLMLVEEIHEYVPEGGGMDECGRMLVKVGKRGRKHGLGIVGISQRPADVKKDFITQCDWLLWHRLTWSNDTKVAGRILGNDYRERVEELGDGECFMMSDFGESLRQVQMERKRTFDAGATPGLDDFERPELKSVSEDLVGELQSITEREQQRDSRIQELERQLKDKDERIKQLEAELEEARDLSEMAEQFSRAMMAHATGRAFRDDITGRQSELPDHADASRIVTSSAEREAETTDTDEPDDRPPETPARVGRGDVEPEPQSDSPTTGEADAAASTTPTATRGATDGGDTTASDTPAGSDLSDGSADAAAGGPLVGLADSTTRSADDDRPIVAELREAITSLDDIARRMLAYYNERGPASPLDAHVAAGGTGDRTAAYRRNGQLRTRGLIAHAGRGEYRPKLRTRIREAHDDRLDEARLDAAVTRVTDLLPSTVRAGDEGADGSRLQS